MPPSNITSISAALLSGHPFEKHHQPLVDARTLAEIGEHTLMDLTVKTGIEMVISLRCIAANPFPAPLSIMNTLLP
jgi:hypothetical protein